MPKVSKIGKEYKSAFDSICELYKYNYISKDIIEDIDFDSKTIKYRDTIFEYSPYEKKDDDLSTQMLEDGASWFKNLRTHQDLDSSSSDWLSLISDVAESYHKINSFLEFKQKEKDVENGKKKIHLNYISEFINTFYSNVSVSKIEQDKSELSKINIYAVNFLMNINNGVGEYQKVLGKVYFKKVGNTYSLLPRMESEKIEQDINAIIDSNEFDNVENEYDVKENDTIINDVLSQLEVVTGDSRKFTDAVVFTSEKDEKIINDYLMKGPQIEVNLDCNHLRVFSIYHIKWSNVFYAVESATKPLFNVLVNSNDELTILCSHCANDDNGIIVYDNKITFNDEDGVEHQVILDFSKENCGLRKEELSSVIKYSNVSKHMMRKVCADVGLKEHGISCERIVCEKDTFIYEGDHYCKNCPHPKKVYVDENGMSHITDSMVYVSDLNKLIEKYTVDETGNKVYTYKECSICGRNFASIVGNKNTLCSSCSKLIRIEPEDSDNVYDDYKELLPLRIRLRKKNKITAVEDYELILFKIKRGSGNVYYKSDKIAFKEKGFIDSPKKIKDYRW